MFLEAISETRAVQNVFDENTFSINKIRHFWRIVCNEKRGRERADGGLLSPVRLPFRHTGQMITLRWN